MATVATGGMTIEVTAPHPAHGGLVDVLDSLGYVKDVSDPHLGLGVVYDDAVLRCPEVRSRPV